ncbi:GTP pyrophosphokinase [Rothia kristinae]|uniref:GTP pyrophosphokinase family protein n=1 Tax=Rothia kristinae TaxID=37923 RepID=A0A7T3CHI7_9MICC|nr:GTP pyrophosphokinase family protein [Rothia kristinae]QPT54311.1 GTP pyrophosphokinase family protein [Rothia kristinae]SQC37074.1 GTP pyrophosphokinase ywaC [Rothia kristinae]
MGDAQGSGALDPTELSRHRKTVERFLLEYECAIDEVETKVRVLRRELSAIHSYNPIESFSSRLKSLDSLARKAQKRGLGSLPQIRESITDIAGVRVICSFTADVYRVREMLCRQDDVRLVVEKDYIADPKPNGYRSLHLILEIPVFLSTGPVTVPVEVQLRTIAMDFWASLEHKIFYKYDGDVPSGLLDDLTRTADSAASMDGEMERLHQEMQSFRTSDDEAEITEAEVTEAVLRTLTRLARGLGD